MTDRPIRRLRFAEDDQVFVVPASKAATTVPGVDPRKAARGDAYLLIPKGYGHLLEGCFEDHVEDCTQKQENINAYVAGIPNGDNARGLERYMCPQHRDERDEAREDVVEAVLKQQRRLARRKSMTSDNKWDKLRAASRKQSRASKVFARRMGLADELAVREDQEEDSQLLVLVGNEIEESTAPILCLTSSFRGFATPVTASSSETLCNTQKTLRQPFRKPSTRQLDTGIRSMAASMNAKQASRQASMRMLNCSIRNLASSLDSSCSNHSFMHHAFSESQSSNSFAATPLQPDLGYVHPSLSVTSRSRAPSLPGRPGRSSITKADCAELIQSVLDFVDDTVGDDDDDDCDSEDCETCRNSPPLAVSA